MAHVFTYGSLMFDQVWSRVVSHSYDREEAILSGYDRKSVRGEVFPVVVPASPDSQVQGIVYRGVSLSDLSRLDRFERDYYDRKTVAVVTLDTKILSAEVYVLREEYYWIISPQEWDPVQFSSRDMYNFIQQYHLQENETKQ